MPKLNKAIIQLFGLQISFTDNSLKNDNGSEEQFLDRFHITITLTAAAAAADAAAVFVCSLFTWDLTNLARTVARIRAFQTR